MKISLGQMLNIFLIFYTSVYKLIEYKGAYKPSIMVNKLG